MKYLKLILALVVLYLVIGVVIPAINRSSFLKEFQENVRKGDINTAAFFYTDYISSKKEIQKYTDK
ncbi:MAG: hypothetical protein R3Y51_05915 [Rikenellaceae bacterium]